MTRSTVILALLFAVNTSSYGITCEALKSEINQKIKAAGVANYSLVLVETEAGAPGKVVGSCDNGKKKIVYFQNASTRTPNDATSPVASGGPNVKRKTEKVLTECKEGYSGPDCKQRMENK